mgnify:CR=1 FL=1
MSAVLEPKTSGPANVADMSSKLAFSKKLQAVTNRIHSTTNIDEIMLDVTRDICQLFDADRLTIYTLSEDAQSIVSKVKSGLNSFKDIKLPLSESSIAGCSALNKRFMNIKDVYDDSELKGFSPNLAFLKAVDQRTGYRTKQMMVVPITGGEGGGELLGVIQVINHLPGTPFPGLAEEGLVELSKTLAEFLFDDENALISLDMSEYGEKHTVSRLFGAPPGFVGFEEGGQLTEKVRRKPFSVVLFDEIEKAHPDVFNTLLQILEDGRLTDAQGRVVDFKNTVLIMTSNLGTRDISKGFNLGFQKDNDTIGAYERMKTKVQDELKQHFRPEFLNRIDDIVVFHQLSEPEILQIVDLMLARLDGQLRNKDMGLEVTVAGKKLLAKKGYDPVLGARPLRRTIQRELEDELSEQILYGTLTAGHIVVVDVEGEGDAAKFVFRGEPKPTSVPDVPPVDLAGSPGVPELGSAGDPTAS